MPNTQRNPADNYDRLLAILERNLAGVKHHESELARRLRSAIHTIQVSRGTTTDRVKEADAGHGADPIILGRKE